MDTAGGRVLVAPFTAELRGGALGTGRGGRPNRLSVVHLDGDAELFAAAVRPGGASRDAYRPDDPAGPPTVPHIALDAALTPGSCSPARCAPSATG